MAGKAKKTTKAAPVEKADKDIGKEASQISETIRSIKTKFGDDSIMTLSETKKVDVEAVST